MYRQLMSADNVLIVILQVMFTSLFQAITYAIGYKGFVLLGDAASDYGFVLLAGI